MLQFNVESVNQIFESRFTLEVLGWLTDTNGKPTDIRVECSGGVKTDFDVRRFARPDVARLFKKSREPAGFELVLHADCPDNIKLVFSTAREKISFDAVSLTPFLSRSTARFPRRLKFRKLLHTFFARRSKTSFPDYDQIRDSGYFDEVFYWKMHKAELGRLDPLTHYLQIGWKKGYPPSERFAGQYYRDFYFDLDGTDVDPLYHYIRWGKNEGRYPFPLHPRFEQYFPEDYGVEAFWQRRGKYLIAAHMLNFTGVPILAKMVAEIFAGEKSAAVIAPMDGPLREACVGAGIPVLIDFNFFVHKERAAFYKENGFSVCLFNTLWLITAFLRNAGTIPAVLWIHDNQPKSLLSQNIQNRIQYAPNVFATSKMTRNIVREYNPGVRYLPYPVKDMGGHHKTVVPDRIRFGVMGVYSERKGQDLAIEAFKNLPAPLKAKAELMLFGDAVQPEYAKKLETMALGEEHIHFVPAEKDPAAYHQLYEHLEVQICPSRTDPMPLVVFDGMMHGCPEILSDTVGQGEFIRNGENGYVFPSENPTALRDCMVRILEEPDRFINMSRSIRQTFLDNAEFTKVSGIIRQVLDEVKTYF